MHAYTLACAGYILQPLQNVQRKDPTFPLMGVTWTEGKKGTYQVVFPHPLIDRHRKLLEAEGVRFIF